MQDRKITNSHLQINGEKDQTFMQMPDLHLIRIQVQDVFVDSS